ncbi:biotin/lipoyl-containing protein [Rhodoferax sp. U11-2br]|uniref:biotin/lipoyl-containing protein n=1 Tax=Rhodoferax sp. U11-2br TaxID=2838878 RepID=UPI001BED3375|nr:biotin/lipoyl-containing protein [Rhodoferax sp. U11-2br]MBT3067388.1 biotin/lipoyl-binding protein [Rhodoferax sp. U11-2br]
MTRLFKVTVNGREYDVAVLELTPGAASTGSPAVPGLSAEPVAGGVAAAAPVRAPVVAAASAGAGDEVAQMGGVIVQVNVKVGQTVAVGDSLLVLEAMKMKNHLLASRSGTVTRVLVAAGDAVEGGQPVLTIQ